MKLKQIKEFTVETITQEGEKNLRMLKINYA
jgi:hypothetical protein